MSQRSIRWIRRWYNWKVGKPPDGKEWKPYGGYSFWTHTIHLNLEALNGESQHTIVYCLTHEYLHAWIAKHVGIWAALKLDIIGHKEYFPITEDEPLIKPLRWGGIHKRSLFQLMWTHIVMSNWENT